MTAVPGLWVRRAEFNEDQPRGADGKWEDTGKTEDSGSGGGLSGGDVLQSRAEAFTNAGGQVREVSEKEAGELRADLADLRSSVGEMDARSETGFNFTDNALSEAGGVFTDGDATVFVAETAQGDLAGAISIATVTDEFGDPAVLDVSYLGTTSITEGAGSALALEAARTGASEDIPVVGTPTSDAAPFWESVGWHDISVSGNPEEMQPGWSVDDMKAIAA